MFGLSVRNVTNVTLDETRARQKSFLSLLFLSFFVPCLVLMTQMRNKHRRLTSIQHIELTLSLSCAIMAVLTVSQRLQFTSDTVLLQFHTQQTGRARSRDEQLELNRESSEYRHEQRSEDVGRPVGRSTRFFFVLYFLFFFFLFPHPTALGV